MKKADKLRTMNNVHVFNMKQAYRSTQGGEDLMSMPRGKRNRSTIEGITYKHSNTESSKQESLEKHN